MGDGATSFLHPGDKEGEGTTDSLFKYTSGFVYTNGRWEDDPRGCCRGIASTSRVRPLPAHKGDDATAYMYKPTLHALLLVLASGRGSPFGCNG